MASIYFNFKSFWEKYMINDSQTHLSFIWPKTTGLLDFGCVHASGYPRTCVSRSGILLETEEDSC